MLSQRQQKILQVLVESFVEEAVPVASQFLAKKIADFEVVSPATIRNDLAALEKENLIVQPHTSAGRIPTEKGYRFYVDNFLQKDLATRCTFSNDLKISDRQQIKELAKKIAEIVDLAVLVSFGGDDNYYTGLSNLFSQKEFHEQEKVVNISALVEKFDNIVTSIFERDYSEPLIEIGEQGCFGEGASFVSVKEKNILIGILGPIRMNYSRNYCLLKKVKEII
ncbi:MAG: hypothetical protein WCT18_00725 [Patescibacteria group bacterium]